MVKKVLIFILTFSIFYSLNTSIAQAVLCDINDPKSDEFCKNQPPVPAFADYTCERSPIDPTNEKLAFCQKNPFKANFGKIQAPDAIKKFVTNNPTGAIGISQFLSNLIALFYTVAAVALIFMLLWGAFEWMTSGGDKEKIESARRRIISAIIGLLLFAIAFAVIQVLGNFTGFKFFVGQK